MDPTESWPFEDPPNVAVYTTRYIVRDGLPVLRVTHDEDDGAWQFHHGGPVADEDAMIVGLGRILSLHPELAELSDLPCGWMATRESVQSPWHREKQPPE
jgi:hypothetical protein